MLRQQWTDTDNKISKDKPEYPIWRSNLSEGLATELFIPLLEQAISGAGFLAQSQIHLSS